MVNLQTLNKSGTKIRGAYNPKLIPYLEKLKSKRKIWHLEEYDLSTNYSSLSLASKKAIRLIRNEYKYVKKN